MKANYEEDKIIVSSTEPTGIDRKKVWIKKGKNFVDFSKCIMGIELHSTDGTFVSNNDYYVTDYIPIIGGHTYTSSGFSTPNKAYYDENLIYISRTTTETAIAPENAKYIVGVSLIEGYPNPQIVEGDVAIPYEPYIKKEIYVKNDNGVFEGFLKYDDIPQESGEVSLGNGTYYKKYGKVVSVYGQSRGGVTLTSDYLELGILPVGARPSRQTLGIWTTIGINTSGLVVIETTGSVKIFGGTTNSSYWGFNITFIAD